MLLVETADTTTLSYWMNWRVLLCAIWVLTPMIVAAFIIWKYEGPKHPKSEREETEQDIDRFFSVEKAWRPCLEEIHPCWLLAFRIISFCFLLATLIGEVVIHGGGMFFYYTQWTFTLVTIYFGFGSLLSIYGCYQYDKMSGVTDSEQGSYMPLLYGDGINKSRMRNTLDSSEENSLLQTEAIWSHLFQVIFQINAGAVMLTDCIYWFIIFPFLTIKDYNMSFMTVNMHTLNAVLLLCDTALNCLPFPWFRIAYFVLWTGIFVIFQWIIHACVSIWWPYPFLDLSSPFAPLWYLAVALMHIPCYAIFALVVEIKHNLLSKWFPQSYQCLR
ncbi:hypothetical protein AAG906_023014 [Vitis piasezkii]